MLINDTIGDYDFVFVIYGAFLESEKMKIRVDRYLIDRWVDSVYITRRVYFDYQAHDLYFTYKGNKYFYQECIY